MGGGASKEVKKETKLDDEWNIISRNDRYNTVSSRNGVPGHEYNYVLDNRYDPVD